MEPWLVTQLSPPWSNDYSEHKFEDDHGRLHKRWQSREQWRENGDQANDKKGMNFIHDFTLQWVAARSILKRPDPLILFEPSTTHAHYRSSCFGRLCIYRHILANHWRLLSGADPIGSLIPCWSAIALHTSGRQRGQTSSSVSPSTRDTNWNDQAQTFYIALPRLRLDDCRAGHHVPRSWGFHSR
jgi:hypothetical protein